MFLWTAIIRIYSLAGKKNLTSFQLLHPSFVATYNFVIRSASNKSRVILPLKELRLFHVYVLWYDIWMVRCDAQRWNT